MAEAQSRRNNMLKEKVVVLEYKINRLGVVGRAYYEASQIKLRRNRYLIRAARTQNMLLHSALQLLQQKEIQARREASNLGGMRKQAMSLRQDFDEQRGRSIAKQLQAKCSGCAGSRSLQKQLTNTRSAEIECADLLDPNTPQLVRIRALDAKLEALYAKTKDTQIVEKHYESLLIPMRDERTLYAYQLDMVSNIITIKKGEIMQLHMLHFDAVRSRDAAKRELEDLLASLFGGKMGGISPEMQKRILAAIKEIKSVMGVGSMREMYSEYVFQEKQSTYLAQIYEELKITLAQLKNEAPIPAAYRRKSTVRLQQVDGIVENTKDIVRRASVQGPSSQRRNSYPLILILEGTKKLVDKIHEGTLVIEDGTVSEEKAVLADCESKLVRLLKGLERKMKHLKILEGMQQAAEEARKKEQEEEAAEDAATHEKQLKYEAAAAAAAASKGEGKAKK